MASIRVNNGDLFFDFRYRNERCREYTKLPDTPANRKRMLAALARIEADIATGQFDYAKVFPGSKLAAKFAAVDTVVPIGLTALAPAEVVKPSTPLLKDFAETWFRESQPTWRDSHTATIRSTLDRHLIPGFGETEVGAIRKADILEFRAVLAQNKGRSGNSTLSPKTVNRVVQVLSQILDEAADRFELDNPADKVKRMKLKKVDIHPFSIDQARQIISTVRTDYQPYMKVRFFTGMRTAEIHGLKWKYVDFDRRQILIRETVVRGKIEYTKTDGSQREIELSQPVFEALKAQQKVTGHQTYVFCNREGQYIDIDNFTNRVWYPLLRHLGFEKRRPYQMRHTCATLWLGSGENPEWIARQLGHADTTMLFKVYSRFVPNLTRKDGSAFDRFVSGALHPEVANAS